MKGSSPRALAAVLAVAGLLLAGGLSACGIPVSASPQSLSADLIPKTLSQPLPTVPQPNEGAGRGPYVTIYLLNPDDKLIPVVRTARKPLTPQTVLNTLEQGPTSAEFAHGMGTALFPGSEIKFLWQHKRGEAAVALDDLFFEQSGAGSVLELGQIVDSLATTFAGIESVQFYWDGAPTYTEVGNGAVVLRPVTPKDYASLLQP